MGNKASGPIRFSFRGMPAKVNEPAFGVQVVVNSACSHVHVLVRCGG